MMNAPEAAQATTFSQTFLIERDAGLLCRILGLYASRGMDVLHVDYSYAAKDFMKLNVSVSAGVEDMAEALRVLVDKASTFVGVLAACEQVADARAPASAACARQCDHSGHPGTEDHGTGHFLRLRHGASSQAGRAA